MSVGKINGGELSGNDPRWFMTSLQGLEGVGKTRYILATCPTPIILINFGERSPLPLLYDLPEERRRQIDIYDIQPSAPSGWTLAEAAEAIAEIGRILREEVPKIAGGTIAIDSGSRLWSAMQLVYVQPKEEERIRAGKKSVGGLIYEEANLRFEGLVTYVKRQPVFFVMTHRLRQDWDADGPIPGSFSARHNQQVPSLVECQIEMFKQCAVCKKRECHDAGHVGRTHHGRLLKAARNTAVEGLTIDNPTFATVYAIMTGATYAGPGLVE